MSEKIIVKRANVLLDVPAEQKDEYLAKGFDVIDKNGKVLAYATKTLSVLMRSLTKLQAWTKRKIHRRAWLTPSPLLQKQKRNHLNN